MQERVVKNAHASPLERRFLRLVAEGLGNKEIAKATGYREHTVKNTLARVYARYDVRDRSQAVLHALRIGDIDMPPRKDSL